MDVAAKGIADREKIDAARKERLARTERLSGICRY
jgi:hypothetical protein